MMLKISLQPQGRSLHASSKHPKYYAFRNKFCSLDVDDVPYNGSLEEED
jgi:hypothetical protein